MPSDRCVAVQSPSLSAAVRILSMMWVLLAPSLTFAEPDIELPPDLTELSLEELGNVEVVTSVSRKPEKQFEAAAAVFVITGEDIRRSGATSIAESLRLAPGVEVARVNSNQWAIGVRGFGSILSRALLVLIDGRSVYSPLYAGVYWEEQDTLLEDVERIEVILGPGGTLWGANAVNGVINIITKQAQSTHGFFATTGGGTLEQGFASARWGGKIGDNFHYRIYAKFFNEGPEYHPDRQNYDSWRTGRIGMRSDWDVRPGDTVTFQGEAYLGQIGQSGTTNGGRGNGLRAQTITGDGTDYGGNVISRWTHRFTKTSEGTIQMYYDRTDRHDLTFREDRDTFDVEIDHRFTLPGRQELHWGLGYRVTSGVVTSDSGLYFLPSRRTDQLFSGFVQDQITLAPKIAQVVIGTKVEHNDYSGWEIQPSGRILLTPTAKQTLWGSVSRAVRTPSRVETDLQYSAAANANGTLLTQLNPNPQFQSEEVVSYELGYRIKPTEQIQIDLAGFYNDYDHLLSVERAATTVTQMDGQMIVTSPFFLGNGLHGKTYGFETKGDFHLAPWLRLRGSYSFLQIHVDKEASSTDTTTAASTEGSSPQHQVMVWLSLDLPGHIELDPIFRYVSALPAQAVAAYANLDVRVAWKATSRLEFAFVGQNLLEAHHAEFGRGLTEVIRSMYARATCNF